MQARPNTTRGTRSPSSPGTIFVPNARDFARKQEQAESIGKPRRHCGPIWSELAVGQTQYGETRHGSSKQAVREPYEAHDQLMFYLPPAT
jgi:hypothetical protein